MAAKTPETSSSPRFPESSFTYNPLMHVRVLFVRFMQGLFAAAPQGAYRWVPDDENTEIYITDENVIQPSVVEKMPTVSLTRGPVQFASLGLDDLEQYDFALGRKTKGILVPGTVTVNCCARNDLESEHIAFVIADHIWGLRDLLLRAGFFDVGRGIQLGSPNKAGSIIANDRGDEFYCTAVSVPYQFARLSAFTPLGKQVISTIQQSFQVRGGSRRLGQGSPRNDPGMNHEIPQAVYLHPPPPFAPDAKELQSRELSFQPHPLNPAVQVCVRVVRPARAGSRVVHPGHLGGDAVLPISSPCVEQSSPSAVGFEQKG